MDEQEFQRRLAEHAVKVFADEWIAAVIPALPALSDPCRARTDERRSFLQSVTRLQNYHAHPIPFMQILQALGNRIAKQEPGLQQPLCELFTYFMNGHPNHEAYAGFSFYRWVARHSAG